MKKRNLWAAALSIFLCALCVVPFLYVLVNSFQDVAGEQFSGCGWRLYHEVLL